MGFFDSGFDMSGWGIPEWATVVFGIYALGSLFMDTKRTVGRVRKAGRTRKSARTKAASLKIRRAQLEREEAAA
jgi:hypothetical protein